MKDRTLRLFDLIRESHLTGHSYESSYADDLLSLDEEETTFGANFDITYVSTDLIITIVVLAVGILIGMLILTNIRTRQKRQAESFSESILNTSLNGIMSFKAIRKKGRIVDFSITFVNQAILTFLKMSRESLTNKTVLQVNPLVKEEGIFQKYVEVTETAKPMKFERKIGKQTFIVLLAKLDDGLICSFYNVTDLKTTEYELNVKVRELEEKNIELEQMAYVTSHDLQEPLRKINMFSDVLMTENNPDEKKAHLNSIIRSVNRMKTLIQKLQEYSKLNRTNLSFREVNLNDLTAELFTLYEDSLQEKGIHWLCDELPMIYGIYLQLYTLFDNLLNNAIKFSRPKSPTFTATIRITAKPVPPEVVTGNPHLNRKLSYIEITFLDNGIGFDQSYAQKIFGIFKKLEGQRTYDDVGIGLALCHKIVRCHQGDIYAFSTPNEGSEFHIILPVFQS